MLKDFVDTETVPCVSYFYNIAWIVQSHISLILV